MDSSSSSVESFPSFSPSSLDVVRIGCCFPFLLCNLPSAPPRQIREFGVQGRGKSTASPRPRSGAAACSLTSFRYLSACSGCVTPPTATRNRHIQVDFNSEESETSNGSKDPTVS
ncbi:unnamed protein product [Linum trigynum]|uniref:Uncharacterized protein n=1 Tax=Linum trigynum TaxID=586398 RepID=A0AAV2FUS7_9ROSI